MRLSRFTVTALRTWLRGALPPLSLLVFAFAGNAAFDAYLKIDGVDGEATDRDHLRWIQVLSFAQGATSPSATTGRPNFSELCLLKPTDRSSPVLEQSCARGRQFPSATLELITADSRRARFYQITLSNVVIGNFSASGSSDSLPTESVCLAFSQIYWTYTEFDAAGLEKNNIRAWWDLVLNVGGNNVNPVLRVTGTSVGGNSLQLAWPGVSGRTYNIRGSPLVTGPYQTVQSVVASADGSMSQTLPIGGGNRFFIIEQAP